ncbi:aliphatic sulfonate ABC transporter substrate-binding protein [Bradyrhizobium sp.]|uniref:taurine ABC transporter substrate-binding protein n=1 Tax=Bradyrhizobium sp. TaxID=376 RepID=UPI003C623CAD
MKHVLRLISATLVLALMSAAALAEPATLRLGYQTGDINTQTMYANAMHLFDDAGLKVELIAFPAGPAMLPALAAAQIDLAWMGEFPIVTGYANGMPIEMILIDRINTTNVRLVASPASGINSLADLKGKKIAVTIGSTSHQHIARALKMAGLKQEDVTLVNLQPGNMPAAYAAGQVDAAFTWEPNISIIENSGGKVIATTKSLGDITGVMLAARSEFTKEHPELVQKFLAAWEKSMQAAVAKPDDVRQYEAKRLGITVPEFSAMLTRMSAEYPDYKAQLTQDFLGVPGQESSARMMIHLKDIGDFLLAEKRINALPTDWSKIINTQPLQAYLAAKKS